MNPHYFGKSQQPLFGIHYPARNASSEKHAVLICPPIAHEHIRTHWSLRLLSQRLAREGFHVMRFDYTGIGDSASWIGEVESVDRWIDDVRLAAEDLLAESGCSRLSIVGLRMGSLLAARATASGLPVEHLVLWEPVLSGEQYLHSIRQMHAQMLDLWVCPMQTDDDEGGSELLGFYFRRSVLNEISAMKAADCKSHCRQLTVIASEELQQSQIAELQTTHGASVQLVQVDEVFDWHQLTEIETAWLQSKSPSQVIATLKKQATGAAPSLQNASPAISTASAELPISNPATAN